jgi:hypothetical protein
MYAVEKPEPRWKSQALACRRVVPTSYEIDTLAPRSRSWSSAFASVDPV